METSCEDFVEGYSLPEARGRSLPACSPSNRPCGLSPLSWCCLVFHSAVCIVEFGAHVLAKRGLPTQSRPTTRNRFSGPIPKALAALQRLTTLNLSGNLLNGSIPAELANLSSLEGLQLQGNNLEGEIPPELGTLQFLQGLDLDHNLLQGQIPAELGLLPSLQNLFLSRNQLGGVIPASLGNLSQLAVLDVSNNNLEGSIPGGLCELPLLSTLNLANNKLGPDLPPELFNNSHLQEVTLSGNNFQGPLPESLANMTALQVLRLDGNVGLSGTFPDTSGIPHLSTVIASGCSFSSAMALGPTVTYLDLSKNLLTALPDRIETLTKLQILRLQDNQISVWPLRGVANVECQWTLFADRFQWSQLLELVISRNPLGVEAQQFVDSLSYLESLMQLEAEQCNLSGSLVDFEINKESQFRCDATSRPQIGFERLQTLDSAGNSLHSVLASPPSSLITASLADNALTNVADCWLHQSGLPKEVDLKGNPLLHRSVNATAPCPQNGSGLFTDPLLFKPVNGTLYECTSLCLKEGGTQVHVDGWTFNSSFFCRCSPGNSGSGTLCAVCPKDTYWASAGMASSCEPCGAFQYTEREGSVGHSTCSCAKQLLPMMLDGRPECRCQDDYYLTEEGLCNECPALTGTESGTLARGSGACRTKKTPGIIALQACIALLFAAAFFFLPVSFSLPLLVITDVSLVDAKLVVSTSLPHYLGPWARSPVPVCISGTGHPGLDRAPALWAKSLGPRHVCLCDECGKPMSKAMDSSQGTLRLRMPYALVSCGYGALPASLLTLICLVAAAQPIWLSRLPPSAMQAEAALGAGLALVVHALLWALAQRTPLALDRAAFSATLWELNPNPQACPPGSGRALR